MVKICRENFLHTAPKHRSNLQMQSQTLKSMVKVADLEEKPSELRMKKKGGVDPEKSTNAFILFIEC